MADRRPADIVDDAEAPRLALRAFVAQELEAGGFNVEPNGEAVLRLEGPRFVYHISFAAMRRVAVANSEEGQRT